MNVRVAEAGDVLAVARIHIETWHAACLSEFGFWKSSISCVLFFGGTAPVTRT